MRATREKICKARLRGVAGVGLNQRVVDSRDRSCQYALAIGEAITETVPLTLKPDNVVAHF